MTEIIGVTGKTVIVTGASSGIGAATARSWRATGAVVHHPEYVAKAVLRLLRTGEDTFDIPHGPEEAKMADGPRASR